MFYAAVSSDFVRQSMGHHTLSTTNLPLPQHHYPIHVSVTIPQCPFLQSCELSHNISPGPAQEILVPQPPPPPPPAPQTILPPTTIATTQCSNYAPQIPPPLQPPPPPAHNSSFSYPHHLGMSNAVCYFLRLTFCLNFS